MPTRLPLRVAIRGSVAFLRLGYSPEARQSFWDSCQARSGLSIVADSRSQLSFRTRDATCLLSAQHNAKLTSPWRQVQDYVWLPCNDFIIISSLPLNLSLVKTVLLVKPRVLPDFIWLSSLGDSCFNAFQDCCNVLLGEPIWTMWLVTSRSRLTLAHVYKEVCGCGIREIREIGKFPA
jgi:hypothetical protein